MPPISSSATKSSPGSHNHHAQNSDEKTGGDASNPHLPRLLKQLRPFQKEAYDYATKGVVSRRQFHAPENQNTNKRKKNNDTPNKSVPSTGTQKNITTLNMNGRLLLADEMGLGKSITSLAIMCHYMSEWPLLILCPASLRHIWPNEIEKFLPGLSASSVYVVQGFDDADFYENEQKRKKIKIVVATYSLLQKRSASARCLQDFNFQCVIADESHNLKQKDSQRTQLALPLLRGAKRLALLSGTPALARPVELWTQVYAIAPDLFGSYSAYTKQYCNARRGRFGWDVNGLSNADELHSKIKQIMVRRLKADVLDELPAKQRSLVPVKISNKTKRKECEALMKELRETRQSVADLVGEEAYGANFEARKLLMEAYQASGIAKVSAVSEYLVEWLRGSGTQKVLVFGHHKGVVDVLEAAVAKELKGGGHIRIDGTVNSQERAARVRKFQTCSNVRVAILSMTAAGVGLTLTAASSVMFAELHWTPGVLAQAEDRCHRIGQRSAVNVMYLVCDDPDLSVDMQLWNMLGRKVNNLGRVVDGERNASLGAEKTDQEGAKPGLSGQDELQSFFAETQVQDEKKSKVPVKGTIMSFFAKQKRKTPQSIDKSSKSTTTVGSTSSRKKVEWDCEACTFHNEQWEESYRKLKCKMCGTLKNIVIDIDDIGTDCHTPLHKVTPSKNYRTDSRSSRERVQSSLLSVQGQTKRTEPEIVIIDKTDVELNKGVVPRNLDSTLANTNVCDAQDGTLKSRKKLKMSACQPQPTMVPPMISPSSNTKEPQANSANLLSFSVSKNSGRITIYFADTGESSLTNFEVEQVVTEETADRLMEARLNRSYKVLSSIVLAYNESVLQRLVESLDSKHIPASTMKSLLIEEIKSFVNQFMLLREIEKKILKESGGIYSGINLRQEVLRIMPKASEKSTERYVGGAKERARERVEMGTGDDNDMAILEGLRCAYCGGDLSKVSSLPGVSSTYCSRECTDEGRLKRGGMANQLRAQVFALEGGVCRLCGINGHALYTRIAALEPAERLNALCNSNWKLPKSAKALDRLLQNPKEGDFWQADHIRAVAEGGGGCGLENLRTLCVPCHTDETEKLRSRLKLHKPSEPVDGTQRDIRTMFKMKKLGTN